MSGADPRPRDVATTEHAGMVGLRVLSTLLAARLPEIAQGYAAELELAVERERRLRKERGEQDVDRPERWSGDSPRLTLDSMLGYEAAAAELRAAHKLSARIDARRKERS